MLLLLAPSVLTAEEDSLRTVEKAAEQWVELRTEASRLDAEWATQQPLLESFVRALGERAQTLEARRDFLVAKSAKDTTEFATLEAANRAGLTSIQAADTQTQAAVAELIALRPALPPRLSAALEMSYRTLAKPDATVNERMQIALTVLNRCSQFNRDISYGQEALVLPGVDGERVLDVLYWGLGQGYALDRRAGKAWIGRPEGRRWTWSAHPEAVAAITTLIDIQQDKADPRFVPVPAQLNARAEAAAK